MAARSLGSLTLDLVARIGGFSAGMTEAERVADRKSREIAKKNRDRAKEVEKAWSGATKFLAGAFAGLSVAGIMRSFIQETVAAQNEQAQLAAALKSTGEAAGFSAVELNKMAASMSGNSTFSEGEITRAQTRLMTYVNIVGEQFTGAMQAVIDMSARMGMSVEQSAETVGRALDIPSRGMVSLQRQGFKFTESQIAAAKELERTGRVAEAQAIVLAELESSYGGAAAAARNTLGGAMQALKNQLGSVMTGDGGSLEGVRQAIEQLTTALKNPEIQKSINELMTGILNFSVFSIDAVDGVVRVFTIAGKAIGAAAGQVVAILSGEMKEALNIGRELAREVDAILMRPMLRNAPALPRAGGAATAGGVNPPSQAEIAALAAANSRREANAKAAGDAAKQAQAYVESLRKQLRATENLSVAETVLRDLQEGRLKLAGGVSRAQVLGIAQEIDAARALTKTLEEQKKAREATASMQQKIDDEALASVQVLIDSNQALREEIELMGLEGDALNAVEQARLASTIALKEEALAMAQNAESSATVIESLQREINLLKQRSELLGQRAKRAAEIKEIEELQKFTERAMQNIQDTIGSGLADIMDGNFKNIADGFTKMLNRMVAEAAAAQIMKHLFGDMVKGGEGSGAIGSFFKNIFGSLFGGGRANGGPVLAGGLYEVNENGPEMLAMNGRQYLMMGNQSGTVVPNSQVGGKTINVAVNVTAQHNVSRDSALQQGQRIGQGIQLALARNG